MPIFGTDIQFVEKEHVSALFVAPIGGKQGAAALPAIGTPSISASFVIITVPTGSFTPNIWLVKVVSTIPAAKIAASAINPLCFIWSSSHSHVITITQTY